MNKIDYMNWKIRMLTFLIGLGLALSMVAGCARIVAPTGGDKDQTPPRLDSLNSTPNFQTRFKKQKVVLAFDEWLQLKDVFNQVVVTPPLQSRPEINLRKKTVVFEFPEEDTLRADATYIINFGTAVQDLTEGNKVADLRFVFSTGDYIDSLEVKGTIVDAVDKKPVADILLMLYDQLDDSIVYKEKPFYFSRTDKEGRLTISNIKADTFKVVALEDGNLNYLFDPASERIGFLDTFLILNDSITPSVTIELFQAAVTQRLASKELNQYGLASFVYSKNPEGVQLDYQDIGQTVFSETVKDTIKLWYDMDSVKNWDVYLSLDSVTIDTVRIKALKKSAGNKNRTFKTTLRKSGTEQAPAKINPFEPLSLAFNHPLRAYNTGLISIYEDTTKTQVDAEVVIDSVDRKNLRFTYNWKQKVPYTITLMPGAVTDWFGVENDTVSVFYTSLSAEDFGNIKLTLSDLKPEMDYVLELIDSQKEVIGKELIQKDTAFQKDYPSLPAGTYSIRVVEDRNGNGEWDTGDYSLKLQAERQASEQLDELRANWDLESDISVRTIFDKKKEPEKKGGLPIPPTNKK